MCGEVPSPIGHRTPEHGESVDPSTLSEPQGPGRACAVHYSLEWTVDFVGQRILGWVDITCRRDTERPRAGEAWELVLDAADTLRVTEVLVDGVVLDVQMWCRDTRRRSKALGTPVRIRLVDGEPGEQLVVRLAYQTGAPNRNGDGGSSALHWLTAEQTAGKALPYVFSHCHAINARALLPCQDTVPCKASYSARVRCPAEFNVLMSALKASNLEEAQEPDWETPEGCERRWVWHCFEQKFPIPTYLIAIVCGAVEGRRVGPRTTVWSEKPLVERAAWEFENTERYLAAAEKLCGPYRWEVFDMLVLPPSAPYGGMENPCLAFVTPTILAGDRSQEHIVAHEILHSWSGNLVTAATLEHAWLNEGLTVFLELKLVREICGHEESTLQCMERLRTMSDSIYFYGVDHKFTCLVQDLRGGVDPDDAFSTVPYVKGMSAFILLETIVGGEQHFLPFLRAFFETNAWRIVTSEMFRLYLLEYFREKEASEPALAGVSKQLVELDWNQLFYRPGLPLFSPRCDGAPLREAKTLAARWLHLQHQGSAALHGSFDRQDIYDWRSMKVCVFLDELIGETCNAAERLTSEACELMATVYGFLNANYEIKLRFIKLALGAKWAGVVPAAIEFATSQGRLKFTRPMYRALTAYDHQLAAETFKRHRGSYHPQCAKMVAKDILQTKAAHKTPN
mmetsp:Transcript_34130/g.77883  ORF Transcript_34130/g.77883 Transcript_34130/m.77883 type:complete len:681 (+) Transcript_34130:47-2089(+)